MKNPFDNAAVWISGAGSGLGRALTLELAHRGASVTAADIDLAAAEATAASVGSGVRPIQVDVTDAGAVAESIAQIITEHGRIDFVFNNAGVGGLGGEVQHFPASAWNHVIDVNLRGVINGIAAAYPSMVSQGRGHIVNTASLAGLVGIPGLTPYSATKHAVVGLSRPLRIEAAVHNVGVSVLCPGGIETPIMDSENPEELASHVPWAPDFRRYLGKLAGIKDSAGFARHALNHIARNRAVIIYGARPAMVARLGRFAPGTTALVSGREYRAERTRQLREPGS
jgi:NAD(P)-dependent dehydrogenase (short-subunit alcohol dehydrogenase family)